MLTSSLNTTITILGTSFSYNGNKFGFRINIMSVDNTKIQLEAQAFVNSNQLSSLRVCYMATSYT